ncbi:hypothetical protein [Streptomyces rubiginosohelvolus]|uniref:hypothetical protein n=1 Tax=Streptomyces rubiginosohelvolus TaxID=67362 RepID=UPI0036C83D64
MSDRPAATASKLVVEPEVRELGLHHVRAWVLTSDTSLMEPVLSAVEATSLLGRFPHEDSTAGYRRLITSLGYPDIAPAGERLRQAVKERPWKGNGGVVDAVTVASVVVGGGIGLHDLAAVPDQGSIVVRRSPGGERLIPAFSSRSRPIPAGDLTYGVRHPDGAFIPMAWLGKRDSDSAEHQVTPESRAVLVVALGHPQDNPAHTASVITVVAAVLDLLGLPVQFRALAT